MRVSTDGGISVEVAADKAGEVKQYLDKAAKKELQEAKTMEETIGDNRAKAHAIQSYQSKRQRAQEHLQQYEQELEETLQKINTAS